MIVSILDRLVLYNVMKLDKRVYENLMEQIKYGSGESQIKTKHKMLNVIIGIKNHNMMSKISRWCIWIIGELFAFLSTQ